METVRIKTAQNIDIDYEVATLGDRILARLIDGAVFLGVFILGVIFVATADNILQNRTWMVCLGLIGVSLLFFYDIISEVFFNGQSIGKKAMKIRVISLDGASPSVGQYLLRWVFRLVDFTLTSQLAALISVAASEKKQRIGDLVAGTTLIKTSPRTNMNDMAFVPPTDNYEPSFPQASGLKEKEVVLIHEVLRNFRMSDNHPLLHKTAGKIEQHLEITDRKGMDDLTFLKTVVKDYNRLQVADQEAR